MKAKPVRLVRIDSETNMYHAYSGREHINTIQSNEPMDAEFVEYFRVRTEEVMAEIDGPTEPEAA